MKELNNRVALIYVICSSISILLMAIATFKLLFFHEILVNNYLQINSIFPELIKGNTLSIYYLSIIILIFAPLINLIVIIFSFFQKRDFIFTIIAFILLIIMLSAIFLKR